MAFETQIVDRDGAVVTVTLNRPAGILLRTCVLHAGTSSPRRSGQGARWTRAWGRKRKGVGPDGEQDIRGLCVRVAVGPVPVTSKGAGVLVPSRAKVGGREDATRRAPRTIDTPAGHALESGLLAIQWMGRRVTVSWWSSRGAASKGRSPAISPVCRREAGCRSPCDGTGWQKRHGKDWCASPVFRSIHIQ